MPRNRQKPVCPICGKGVIERKRRRLWMRVVPGTRHYLCDWCSARYLTVYGHAIRLTHLSR
jgi:hypothetical protein